MQHLDEGTIHAWLDGALDAAESARVEQHAAACASCAAAVAEARGLVAGASRILSALDHVPGNVVPRAGGGGGAPEHDIGAAMARRRARGGEGTLWRALRLTPARAAAAAVLIVAAGTVLVAREQRSDLAMSAVESPVVADTAAQGPAVAMPAIAPSVPGGGAAKSAESPPPSAARTGRPGSRSDLAKTVRRQEVSAASVPAERPIATEATAPNEQRRDSILRGRVVSAPVVVTSTPKAEAAVSDSVRVTAREEAERRAVRMPVPAPAANAAPGAMRDELRRGTARDVQAGEGARPIVVAGCYAVTSDRPTGLPSRISLDTATSVGLAAGFVAQPAPPTAQAAAPSMARRLESLTVTSRAAQNAIARRVSIPDTAVAGARAAVAGSWMQPSAASVRVSLGLGTTPTTVLVLHVEDVSTLRGFIVGREGVVVTLARVGCQR